MSSFFFNQGSKVCINLMTDGPIYSKTFCRDKGRSMAIRISYKPSGLCTNLYNENNNNKFQRKISQSLLRLRWREMKLATAASKRSNRS